MRSIRDHSFIHAYNYVSDNVQGITVQYKADDIYTIIIL